MVAGEKGGTTSFVKIYNNIVTNCFENGFLSQAYGKGKLNNIVLENNTFVNNATGGAYAGEIYWCNSSTTSSSCRNNLIYNQNIPNGTCDFEIRNNAGANVIIEYNYQNAFNGGRNHTQGNFPILGPDPKFSNLAGGNFHLLAGSICIDAGTAVGAPNVDYDGVARPFGVKVDIGAFEYDGTLKSANFSDETNSGINEGASMSIFPNPANNGSFNLKTTGMDNIVSIQVVDLSGKQVLLKNAQNGTIANNLKSGVYFIKVSDEKSTLVEKLIIK